MSITAFILGLTLIRSCKCDLQIGKEIDFANFILSLNSGSSFNGETVFLTDDIVFGQYSNYLVSTSGFLGTFDGQGHVLKNYSSPYDTNYNGIFGISRGMTAKNVIIDNSCVFENNYTQEGTDTVSTSSLIGICQSTTHPCIIQSVINLASVTFIGSSQASTVIGGIVGYIEATTHEIIVRNCVNYGNVINTGLIEANYYHYVGGVIGDIVGKTGSAVYVQNCLNYGTVLHNSIPNSYALMGGILGAGYNCVVDNCVNVGKVISEGYAYMGSIIGYSSQDVIFTNCYWAKNAMIGLKSEQCTVTNCLIFDNATFKLRYTIHVGNYTGNSLINALNEIADINGLEYSHWLLNRNNYQASFKINNKRCLTTDSGLILFPDLANDGLWGFDGWIKNKPLENYEITSNTDFSGTWAQNINKYFITLYYGDGIPAQGPYEHIFGEAVDLTTSIQQRDNCKFKWWETEQGEEVSWSFTMPAHNITLYAVWSCTRITTPKDLVDLSRVVEAGENFAGKTVFLDSDIEFTDKLSVQFQPIGRESGNYFLGNFDGQGHAIKNLKIKSSLSCVGLFAYSFGSLKNVIIDSSCSIESFYFPCNYANAFIGSIVGTCYGEIGKCAIENIINMGNVSFKGYGSSGIIVGGIAGTVFTYSYAASLKNNVNYGTLAFSGFSAKGYMGGVVGYIQASSNECLIERSTNFGRILFDGNSINGNVYIGGINGYLHETPGKIVINDCSNYGEISYHTNGTFSSIGGISGVTYGNTSMIDIRNSINYGKITSDGDAYIGGIAGWSSYTALENCVSEGAVVFPTTTQTVGSFIGYADDNIKVSQCYWTSKVDSFNISGEGSTTTTNSNLVQMGTSLLETLNKYASTKSLTRWAILHLNGGSIDGIDYESPVVLQSRFPNPLKENNFFMNWFADAKCTTVYDFSSSSNLNVTDIYAGWNTSIVTFLSTNDTIIESMTLAYGKEIICPSKLGYTASSNAEYQTAPPFDINITVTFEPNAYTVVFNASGGNLNHSDSVRTVVYDSTYGQLPVPTKIGHSFVGWFTETTGGEKIEASTRITSLENYTLYARWSINSYTITVDFDNGTKPVIETLIYGDEIYLEAAEREGYTFVRWEPDIKTVPDHNITIKAIWDELPKESHKDGGNGGLVAGIVVPLVIIIIAAVLIVLFILMKKRNKENDNTELRRRTKFNRVVAASNEEVSSKVVISETQSILCTLYPPGYSRPGMREALLKADLTYKEAAMVCEACTNVAAICKENGTLSQGITEEDAAAIAMYTYDFGSDYFEHNPYRIINKSLVGRNYASLQKASGMLYLALTGLRKLPKYTGRTLYRGVRSEVTMDEDHYHEGNTIAWPALSSTSPDMNTTKAFLAKGSSSGKAEGTLFIIEGGWGYNIQPYSLFPDEVEILLEPERQFRVMSIIQAEGLTFVNLKMLDTPLVLPDVFK